MTSTAIQRDEFASEEYVDSNARLPRIQALRGSSPKNCGFFIQIDQAAKAGWNNFDEKTLIEYAFEESGKTEQGILIQSPRMLVCPRSEVLAWDRNATRERKMLVVLGRYLPEHKVDSVGNLQLFEVFLLDENNQPLHQLPFALQLKGATQATFSQHWQQFCNEMTFCHAVANQIPARPKNMLFRSLCVFSFKVAPEQAGAKVKSKACKVVSHEKPTLENWKDYFVGFDSETKLFIHESLQPTRPKLVESLRLAPAEEFVALPPSEDEHLVHGVDF